MPYWRDRNWLSITAIVCAIIFSAPIHCDFGFSLPGKICQNVSEVEVRYRDYYPFYLSSKPPQMARGRWKYQPGLLAKRITDAAKTCCPNVNVTFKWIGNVEPHKHVTLIAQREVLRSLLDKRNQSNSPQKFIFYFPEFTSGRVSEIYPYPTPFLSVLNSPGHAVVMLKSDAKRATSPGKLLAPSVPLVIVIFAAALIFGLAIWLLVSFDYMLCLFQFCRPLGVFFEWHFYQISHQFFREEAFSLETIPPKLSISSQLYNCLSLPLSRSAGIIPKSFHGRSFAVFWRDFGGLWLQ